VAKSAIYKDEGYDIANDQPLQIGFGAHDYFNGKLNDVRLYNRALTSNEIEQLAER
jgi:hypothetical protein